MIKSMTGFGRCEIANEKRKFTIEMKSVNHRYFDVNIKMPKKLNFFESSIRNLLKEYIERGKVDVYISYEDYSEDVVVLEGAFDFGSHIAELEEIAYSKVTEAESKLETVEAEKVEAETNYTNIQAEFDTTKSELETVKSDYEVIKTKLDDIEPKYNDYVQAEEQRKVDEMNSLKDAKISEFEELLSDVTEFTELKDKKDELSVEEIENKCAVMFYKKQAQSNFAKKTDGVSSTRIYNNEEDSKTVVSTKYGNIVIGK